MSGRGLHVAGGQGQHHPLGFLDDVVLVHHHGVVVAQEAELAGFEGARGDLRRADKFKGALNGGQEGLARLELIRAPISLALFAAGCWISLPAGYAKLYGSGSPRNANRSPVTGVKVKVGRVVYCTEPNTFA